MRKGKIVGILLVLVLTFSLVACGGTDNGGGDTNADSSNASAGASNDSGTSASTEEEVVELKLAYYTASDSSTGPVYEFFAQAVEEESGGSLQVTTFPAETLLANAEALDGIRNGQADFAHFMVAMVSPTINELTPLEVPGAYLGDKYVEYNAALQPILEEIFDRYGVKYLSAIDQGTITFMSSKALIQKPDDIKGMTVRSPGKWVGEAITQWGGSPVTVPLGDIATALERKTIDTSYGGWVISGPFKFYEMAPNVTYTTLQEGFAGLIMCGETWDKLTAEQQEAVTRAAKRYGEFSNSFAAENFERIYNEIQDYGAEIYTLSEAENAEFTKVTEGLLEQAIEVAGEDGQKIADALKALR